MTTMSDLPETLEDEILSRIPITSLRSMRSTCKKWNTFSKTQIIGNGAKQSLGLMLRASRHYRDFHLCSMSFNLQGIRNEDDGDYVLKIDTKQVSIPEHIRIYKISHCDGLFLCLVEDKSSILVWNPYLAQTRWIKTKQYSRRFSAFVLGYDNNYNHKILKILEDHDCVSGLRYEIYRFNSILWEVLNVTPELYEWSNMHDVVSLKGNTYLFVKGNTYGWADEDEDEDEDEDKDPIETDVYLLCFDFTTESFGPRLPLPFSSDVGESVTLSSVREEQLLLLYNGWETSKMLEIWVSNKIEPNAVSWTKFLKVDTTQLTDFPDEFDAVSFFIDEEKKVAVVFNRYIAHIIGEDGYSKSRGFRLWSWSLLFLCSKFSAIAYQLTGRKRR
ncbi:F-box protein [Cardamine amara subsp. amara]|uniref:F-box protein n=1 Tax=Cardamine amara subsp. amara TaxID=228776 RepID=A0ABD1AR45_CARAN